MKKDGASCDIITNAIKPIEYNDNSKEKSYKTNKSSEKNLIVLEGDNTSGIQSKNYEKEINYISDNTKLKKSIKYSSENLSFINIITLTINYTSCQYQGYDNYASYNHNY